jgi:hypothetical protein
MYHYITRFKLFIETYIELAIYHIKNIFSNNVKIYLIEDYKIVKGITNIKLLYFINFLFNYITVIYNIIRPELRKQLEEKRDYYCIIHNKYGVCKTIYKYQSMSYILNQKNIINIENKTERIYGNNMIEEMKLIRYNETELNFTDLMMNIDRELNLTLEQFFKLHDIKYNLNDKIYIKYMNYMNCEESCIVDELHKFINLGINHEILFHFKS